jgi:hypothetical protein
MYQYRASYYKAMAQGHSANEEKKQKKKGKSHKLVNGV